MGKCRTSKSKYPSHFAPIWITPAQYLTEILFKNIASKEGIILNGKFWMEPKWKKQFAGQVSAANKLLRNYSFTLLAYVLERNTWLVSLRGKLILDIINKTKYIEPKTKKENIIIEDKTLQQPRQIKQKNKNLRRLDG